MPMAYTFVRLKQTGIKRLQKMSLKTFCVVDHMPTRQLKQYQNVLISPIIKTANTHNYSWIFCQDP